MKIIEMLILLWIKRYDKKEVFRKYSDNYNNNHLSIIISNTEEDKVRLIESCYDGNIRVWDFYSGLLLNKIKIGDNWLYGICLWNTKYLFVKNANVTERIKDTVFAITTFADAFRTAAWLKLSYNIFAVKISIAAVPAPKSIYKSISILNTSEINFLVTAFTFIPP